MNIFGNMVRDLAGNYFAEGPLTEGDILNTAENILAEKLYKAESLTKPEETKRFLIQKLAAKEHEVFAVIFMDNRHQIIAYEEMFRGTINGASVHPREVVKRALQLNAAAVIISHNHPSGCTEPSQADISITKRLKEALALVETRVLDHIIVGGTETISLAEQGLI